jgi:hypothetical protein
MYDTESLITEELNRLAPGAEVDRPDWANVVTRAGAGRRSRRVAPVVAIALVGIAAPTVALSSGVRGLLGLGTSPVFHLAKPLVSGPVGNNFFAHLWQSPSTTGGRCLFATYDHSPTEAHPPRDWNGGGACSVNRTTKLSPVSASRPLAVSFSIQRRLDVERHTWVPPVKWVPPVVAGAVYPGLHATRIAVEWRGGSHTLALHNGWFVGGTPTLYVPPLRKFPFVVIAYDRAGHELARKKLDSPSLLMLQHGWKEFARKYHAWQKRKR